MRTGSGPVSSLGEAVAVGCAEGDAVPADDGGGFSEGAAVNTGSNERLGAAAEGAADAGGGAGASGSRSILVGAAGGSGGGEACVAAGMGSGTGFMGVFRFRNRITAPPIASPRTTPATT